MTKAERKALKKRLLAVAKTVAKEFNDCREHGDSEGAKDAKERWQILFRAAAQLDNFDLEE